MKFVKNLKIIISLLLISISVAAKAGSVPDTGRTWTYFYIENKLTPQWSVVLMPGHKYEFVRDDNKNTIDTFVYELFVGPQYTWRWENIIVKLPVWYYYVGMPVKSANDYYATHNVSLVPKVTYSLGDWSFSFRLFVYNTFYASYYSSDEERRGYSLMTTEMLEIKYRINKFVSLLVADEIFTGIIEDSGAEATSGIAFMRKGFLKNKFYTGASFRLMNNLYLKLQYLCETNYDKGGDLLNRNHYIYSVFSFIVDFQEMMRRS